MKLPGLLHCETILLHCETIAEFDKSVSMEALSELADFPPVKVLQFSSPVSPATLQAIDEHFFAKRPDVTLRVYGGAFDDCDLGFVPTLRHVKHFHANSLLRAKNIACIGQNHHLETLSIGIFECGDFRFMEHLPTSLKSLYLGQTRSRKLDLAHLERLANLTDLGIEGHRRNLEVFGRLTSLKSLTLRGMATPAPEHLGSLSNLMSLQVNLGSIDSLGMLAGHPLLRYLSIIQVREFRDVQFLNQLPNLQNLHLQSLPHIRSLPSLRSATKLRRVTLENLKTLEDFRNIADAPALEEFSLVNGRNQNPSQLLPLLNSKSVKRVSAHFASHRANQEFVRLRSSHQLADWWQSTPFMYE